MKSVLSVLLLPFRNIGLDRKEDLGKAARSEILRTSREGGRIHAGRGRSGQSGQQHVIWIGSSQPNVSAGSQRAW